MSVAGKRPGRLWTWLDERVGLADLEKLARCNEAPVDRVQQEEAVS